MADAGEVSRAAGVVTEDLADRLAGLVLHGSAVSGGLRPDSDIDLLAVVTRSLTLAERVSLTEALLRISGGRAASGPARPLELTVVVAKDLRAAPSSIATDYQYGEWLRDEIEAGSIPARHHNPDLALVLAMARAGVSVWGSSPPQILPEISRADVEAAMVAALPGLLDDVDGDERNVVLTLARMQMTKETGRFAPKDVAAEYVAERVPAKSAQMLRTAAAAYRGEATDDWAALRPALLTYLAAAKAQLS